MAGIKFSLLNPKLYLLMAYGVCTPHLYRYFETGKRKAWPGAREAIERVNRESAEDSKRGVEEWKATKQHSILDHWYIELNLIAQEIP